MKQPFEYIRGYYGVPAEYNREVVVEGRKGVITEDKGSYIGVIFYDKPTIDAVGCHPIWEVEYLDTFNHEPPKVKNYKAKRRYADYLHSDTSFTFGEWLRYRCYENY